MDLDFSDKVALLQEIDAFARARDPRVVQVMASMAGERRTVEILRADGRLGRRRRRFIDVGTTLGLAESFAVGLGITAMRAPIERSAASDRRNRSTDGWGVMRIGAATRRKRPASSTTSLPAGVT